MPPSFSCRFVSRKCEHERLFGDAYLRTNRTNHTKIMRCFPHCCPSHRQRSYCGSPMFVQFDQYEGHRVPTHDLVVYGRFRPLTPSVPPLSVGTHLPLSTIEASLQRKDPSTGEWIEAELSHSIPSHQDAMVSWVFEVNASGRWYYPWGGAATISLRAMEHVFEVLVFRRVDALQLQLLAAVVSSTFRLKSFRRGVINRSDAEAKTGNATTPTAKRSTERKASFDDQNIPQNELNRSPPATLSQSLSRAASPTNTITLTSPSSPLSTAGATSTVATNTLSALVRWLDSLPINSAGSRCLAAWKQIVMDNCAAYCASAHGGVRHIVHRPLTSILSDLQVSGPQSAMPARASPATPLDVVDAAVRTLLHLYLDAECSTQLTNATAYLEFEETVVWGGKDTDTSQHLRKMYAIWSHTVEAKARRFANDHTSATWYELTAAATAFQPLHTDRDALADARFGYRAFVAQRRECFAQWQRRHAEETRARQLRRESKHGISISSLVDSRAPAFIDDPRVWVSRTEDVTIEMVNGSAVAQQSLSLLTVLEFWRNLCCLRLEYTDDAEGGHAPQPELRVASIFNHTVTDSCYTRLTLDGRHRWFHCLPCGDATTGTSVMGYVVGDYIGRVTSAGAIHVTTFLWPRPLNANNRQACAWHWTIDAASMMTTSSLTVSVIVETATIQRHHPSCSFETMEIDEKLRCVGHWRHTNKVQFQYHAQ